MTRLNWNWIQFKYFIYYFKSIYDDPTNTLNQLSPFFIRSPKLIWINFCFLFIFYFKDMYNTLWIIVSLKSKHLYLVLFVTPTLRNLSYVFVYERQIKRLFFICWFNIKTKKISFYFNRTIKNPLNVNLMTRSCHKYWINCACWSYGILWMDWMHFNR